MGQEKENNTTNEPIRDKFYHITTVQNQISIREITFVGIFYAKTLTSQPSLSPLGAIIRENTAKSSQQING